MNKAVEMKKQTKPVFRGRFGTRTKRSSSIAKWDKWRVPRGIDIKWKRGDGAQPGIGYKTKSELRHMHPKGKFEFLIKSERDILEFDKKDVNEFVFRFKAGIGNKKKTELVKLAKEKGMHILNPKVYVKKKKEVVKKSVAKTEVKTEKDTKVKDVVKEIKKE